MRLNKESLLRVGYKKEQGMQKNFRELYTIVY